jgi:hypothetical protein
MSVRVSGRARAKRAVKRGRLGSASGGAIRRSRNAILRGRSPSFELADGLFIAVPFALHLTQTAAKQIQRSGDAIVGP